MHFITVSSVRMVATAGVSSHEKGRKMPDGNEPSSTDPWKLREFTLTHGCIVLGFRGPSSLSAEQKLRTPAKTCPGSLGRRFELAATAGGNTPQDSHPPRRSARPQASLFSRHCPSRLGYHFPFHFPFSRGQLVSSE